MDIEALRPRPIDPPFRRSVDSSDLSALSATPIFTNVAEMSQVIDFAARIEIAIVV
ncbi:hypothetical protein N184_15930 [Sinorhizobium sp. GL28]|nr:hypothetical protein N184_15930 [Sinorhizobium sp. GL28]